ncbi:OLC1v1011649C1 [Oldenlandia corymbosa var. corymbosa]|uniref:Glycosyltransferase n=1 Tax=Oldenlandia corymbosa var. corymbosa TaxID=529605 RepID=A0AAV1DU28_OLDCO|nr:OLC1v1011649C1 [Oldenlandia corymbosa var. corymbosa]
MATETKKQLHVVVLPWLAFGHMIPFLELSKSIAQRGHKVTFVSTPRNIQRLPKFPSELASSDLNFLEFHIPRTESLPENAEATADVPLNKVHFLKKAFDDVQIQVAQFLETSRPDWLIYDFACHLLPSAAAKLGISLAFFSSFNGWSAAFFGSPSSAHQRTKPEDYTAPPKWIPFPSRLAFRRHELGRMAEVAQENASGVSDWERFSKTVTGCDAVLIRSCRELESEWLGLVQELLEKPVIPVGLLPQTAQDGETELDKNWQIISDWLDNQARGSVIYVALGTEVSLSEDEVNELATGLELSGLPFFWTLRPNPFQSLELPSGFEERVKGRGLVWRSWAPQLKILSHGSIGGFLTHCGWSSIIEGLQHGKPLVMLPFQADQGLNARILEDKMVGVEVSRSEDGSLRSNWVGESIRLIMTGEKGQIYRDKAAQMKNVFGDKDLQEKHKNGLVEYLEKNQTSPAP